MSGMIPFKQWMFVTFFELDLPFDKNDFVDKLFPNGWESLVVQLLAFGVLVLAATFLLYKPVKKLIKARGDYVEQHLQNAEKSDREASSHLEEAKAQVSESRLEAQKILTEARQESENLKDAMLIQAQAEVKEVKRQADLDIKQSQKKAIEDVHNEIVNVALEASKVVLGREVNDQDQARLVRDFIKEVEQ